MSWRPQTTGERIGLLLAVMTLAFYGFNVVQQAFVADDAYISFRYAQNLVAGDGLVWNPGEAVEGYTNFSWVLWIALAMRLGLDPLAVAQFSGVVAGLVVLAATARLGSRRGQRWGAVAWIAPLCLATQRSFCAWATGGLETMAFAALLLVAIVCWLGEHETQRARPLASGLLFALAALTRPEGLLFAALAASFGLNELRAGRRTVASYLWWIGPQLALVGGHLAWRQAYYGAWLPNSFYAKVPGAWWEQGVRYLKLFAADYALSWPAVVLVVALALFLNRDLKRGYLAGALTAYLVYVAFVGGDRFEFRFLVPVMAILYWLLVDGLWALGRRIGNGWAQLAVVTVSVLLVVVTARGGRTEIRDGERAGVASLERIAGYAQRRAEEGRFLRTQIDAGVLSPDLIVCVGGAGALPYFTGWPTVDRRGINDALIARQPLQQRGVVGHEREISFDYLRQRKVVIFDIFNRLVHDRPPQGQSTVLHDGHALPIVSIPLAGRYLVFATPLTAAELAAQFPTRH